MGPWDIIGWTIVWVGGIGIGLAALLVVGAITVPITLRLFRFVLGLYLYVRDRKVVAKPGQLWSNRTTSWRVTREVDGDRIVIERAHGFGKTSRGLTRKQFGELRSREGLWLARGDR